MEFGYGTAALTPSGFKAYDDGNNPDFGVTCGDHVISEFKTGAMLALSLNL